MNNMDDWKQFTKEQLDHEFSPSRFSHRMGPTEVITSHINVLTKESAKARSSLAFEEIKYGETEEQALHVFTPSTPDSGFSVLVYIHGGYWQELSLALSSFMAESFLRENCAVVSIGYDLAPKATMEEIINQVTTGLSCVLKWATEKKSKGVHVTGHSAGGHLAAMMLNVDWAARGVDPGLLKSVIPVSGVFDLRPIVPSYVNEPIKMTDDSAWLSSPMKHVKEIAQRAKGIKILITYAELDPPQFQLQSKLFAKALEENGCPAETMMIAGTDHFDVIERLSESQFVLTQKLVQIMKSD